VKKCTKARKNLLIATCNNIITIFEIISMKKILVRGTW
jgi:hypothetical protein